MGGGPVADRADQRASARQAIVRKETTLYEEVLTRFPMSAVAREAQYYLGVARYKASHEGADVAKAWHRLQTRYPVSNWRVKQAFIER
jgi:outer membrane protein assembly factor BamD (BamD/ComL family)